ncbi:DNA polymerase III subunit beta family protein [Streptomyces griseoluteus]|uniref:DNA polymerase III subunit beta family protein n=1 Tax=Streptomyces griseoluteus TaxID=29306 RepID=UPI003653A3B1
MITIAAKDLRHMLQQVAPHMSDDDTLPTINSVRLETRDGWLYASATDRYTFAVSRRMHLNEAEQRAAHIPGHHVPNVLAWLDTMAVRALDNIELSLPFDGISSITFTGIGGDRLETGHVSSDYKHFPDWRKIFHAALTAEPVAIPLTGFTTKFLARWEHAAERLTTWQQGPGKPIVLLDELGYFAGLHMPVRQEGASRASEAADWIAATTPTATVGGTTYDLTETWLDVNGDPWTYSGKDDGDEPLMVMDGIEDDPHTLARLIAEYGPLHLA